MVLDGKERPLWAIKAQFSTRPNWASNTMVFLSVYFFLTDAVLNGNQAVLLLLLSKEKSTEIFRFRCFSWCARRDLNSRFSEHMAFLKLLFTQNTHFISNIPIFPTDIFTLILLRVLVRVKIRVTIVSIFVAFL